VAAVRRSRTVALLAKTPAVSAVTIDNVPIDLLKKITELAAREGRSRSSFVRRLLQRIVADYQAKKPFERP
jgi:metal-responsive CopG/Arc/MetJ family transcriptional regulator